MSDLRFALADLSDRVESSIDRWAAHTVARHVTAVLLVAVLSSCLLADRAHAADPAASAAGGPASREVAPLPGPPRAMPTPTTSSRAEALEARRKGDGNLVGHGGPIKAIAVDAEAARVATGSFDYALMVWDVSGDAPKLLQRFDRHGGAVNAVAFVPGATRVLAAGDDGALSVWDWASGAQVHRFEGHTAKVNHVVVSADGRFAVTSSWDRTARLWDLGTMTPGPVLSDHGGPVNAAQFSADGKHVYTACYDGALRLFKRDDGSLVRPLHKHGWGLNVLARIPDTELLAVGALNGSAFIVDGETANIVHEYPPFERPVLSIAAVDKPGLLAFGAGDGSIRVSRLTDRAEIEAYQNPFGPVWAMAFAPGATAIYYGGLDDFATRWQIAPRAGFEAVESPYPRRFQVSGDPDDPIARGELQFARKCSVCHTLKPDGRNRAGPTLYGIFGRHIASLPGYPYSKALTDLQIVWTEETVDRLFALGPDIFTPGSKMPLQKMTDPEQRAALIAFLKEATRPDRAEPVAGELHGASGNSNPQQGGRQQ